jgi:hypothetical protein
VCYISTSPQPFGESKDIWHQSSPPKLHDASPRHLAAPATERLPTLDSPGLCTIAYYAYLARSANFDFHSRPPLPSTSTPRPQPCSASPACSHGSWPPKSSTLRSFSLPPSCFGKDFQWPPTHRHRLSSCCPDPWSLRLKGEICCSYGTEEGIRKWARLWYTTSRARISRSCIVWLGDMVEGTSNPDLCAICETTLLDGVRQEGDLTAKTSAWFLGICANLRVAKHPSVSSPRVITTSQTIPNSTLPANCF